MKNTLATVLCAVILHLVSCNKVADAIISHGTAQNSGYTDYLISKGQQFSDHSGYLPVDTDALNFTVKFDSSAIYTSVVAENQYDINKLYGFSDNNADHHQFSARFGWRWSEGALRLFGYVYNNGVMDSKELQ